MWRGKYHYEIIVVDKMQFDILIESVFINAIEYCKLMTVSYVRRNPFIVFIIEYYYWINFWINSKTITGTNNCGKFF